MYTIWELMCVSGSECFVIILNFSRKFFSLCTKVSYKKLKNKTEPYNTSFLEKAYKLYAFVLYE